MMELPAILFFRCLVCLVLLAGPASYVKAQDSDTLVVEDVNLVPMTGDTLLPHMRVIIRGEKILRIEPVTVPLAFSRAQRINARGKYLVPGFAEMHYHWRSNDMQQDLRLMVANGITTVRNMASLDGQDHAAVREKLRSKEWPSIRYYTTGPYLNASQLTSVERIRDVVKEHKDKRYDYLKLADDLSPELFRVLLSECRSEGLQVVGHAQRKQPLEVSLQLHSIEHIEEFLYILHENGKSGFALDSTELMALARKIRGSGVSIGTTLGVFEFITQCLDDSSFAALQESDLVRYLAPLERENFLTEKNDYRKLKDRIFDGQPAKQFFEGYYKWIGRFAKILSAAGVPLLAGSDTYGMVITGFSLHHEMELLQQTGIRPYDVLQMATVQPAHYLGTHAGEGTIEAGKRASLVLLDKNPLEDIRHTRSIAGVMVRGQWFDRHRLDTMLQEVAAAYKQ